MDQIDLGSESRPEEEIFARRSLEAAFARKYEELTRRLNVFDPTLKSDVSELIEHLRSEEVDFAAEAQAAIGGSPSSIAEAAESLSLLLISSENGNKSTSGQNIERRQTTKSEQTADGQE